MNQSIYKFLFPFCAVAGFLVFIAMTASATAAKPVAAATIYVALLIWGLLL